MARYRGPKHRLARREGANILEKSSASLSRRMTVPPGMHGPKGKFSKSSDYGKQLREKQKAKRTYGLLENQFRKYFEQGLKVKGKTGEALLQALEMRLDNTVFRLGFAPSRAMARQLVTHGHILIDNKRVNIPSYHLKVDQVITLSGKSMKIPSVVKLLEETKANLPAFLERKGAAGRIIKQPVREEIPTDVNEQLIIEYYSR